jgi:hypothetical protein
MRGWALFWGTCLGAFVWASAAGAVTYERQISGEGVRFLLVSGEFVADDRLDEFARAITEHGAIAVIFDSPGGNLYSAMEHGRVLRSLQVGTLQLRNLLCASACSLAFLGGVQRYAEPGSIAVHRSFFSDEYTGGRDQAVADVQAITADVLAYLKEMDVDPELLQLAFQYDSSDMRFLSGSEMARMRVTTGNASASVDASRLAPPSEADRSVPLPREDPFDPPLDTSRFPPPPAKLARNVEAEALALVETVVAAHSLAEDRALSRVILSYGGTVDYYGQPLALDDVVRDKQAYFQRWPERAYSIRADTVVVSCNRFVCVVSGLYDWAVRSYPRNKQATGVATFRYSVNLSNMQIVAEASEVVSR